MNKSALQEINTIACVDGVEYAFEFVKSMKLKKGVLMYTNENETAITDRKAFLFFRYGINRVRFGKSGNNE